MDGGHLVDGVADPPGDGRPGAFCGIVQPTAPAIEAERVGERPEQRLHLLAGPAGRLDVIVVFGLIDILLEVTSATGDLASRSLVQGLVAPVAVGAAAGQIEAVDGLPRM